MPAGEPTADHGPVTMTIAAPGPVNRAKAIAARTLSPEGKPRDLVQ